jgi:CubicO group peptidase (beta-lactamase class C family)
MDRQFADGRSPMLSAVVARHGQVIFTHTVGDQRPGGPPLTLDSVFPIASWTKPMTAATVLALVERGMIGLNEPASVLVPELADAGHGDVFVHQLLTHTSGWNGDDVSPRLAEMMAAILEAPSGLRDPLSDLMLLPGLATPRREPAGQVMQYCNLNYTLLGEIIRRATGDTLDAAMRQYLFEPTGMGHSAVIVPDDMADRVIERAAGIPFGPEDDTSPISFNDPLWAAADDGAGGVHTTTVDLARFGQMILDGGVVGDHRVLSPDAVRVMTTDQIPGVPVEILGFRGAEASWGYGFSVQSSTPWARFSGGLLSPGTARHGGAGGIHQWIDPALGIVGAYIEIVTEFDWETGPQSWAAHRFEDVITAAVLD